MKKIVRHVRSNAYGLIAIFVALGGTAYALDANSVRSRHIVNGQVRSADVANDSGPYALTGSDVAPDSLGAADISALGSAEIANGSVRSEDVADDSTANALTGDDIALDSLSTSDIVGLTSADITNGSLTGADITDQSLSGDDVGINTLGSEDVRQEGLRGEDIDEGTLRVDVEIVSGDDLSAAPPASATCDETAEVGRLRMTQGAVVDGLGGVHYVSSLFYCGYRAFNGTTPQWIGLDG